MSPTPDGHAEYNKSKLFVLSVVALATAGIGFSIRGDLGGALQSHFFDPLDKLHSAGMTASVLGIVFMGFAVAIAIGSPLLDFLGMGRRESKQPFEFSCRWRRRRNREQQDSEPGQRGRSDKHSSVKSAGGNSPWRFQHCPQHLSQSQISRPAPAFFVEFKFCGDSSVSKAVTPDERTDLITVAGR